MDIKVELLQESFKADVYYQILFYGWLLVDTSTESNGPICLVKKQSRKGIG